MAWFVCFFTLAAISAPLVFGQSRQAPGGTPSVAVFMDFDSKPGDASLNVMEREVENLFRPAGVSLEWRRASANSGTESFAGLVVFKFKGLCRVEGWFQPERDGTPAGVNALGSAQVSDGRVLPFGEVQCDQIRKALAYLDPSSSPQQRQQAFGLAMGRVVAHELYHMLARTTVHAEQGLSKATQSLRDLVTAPGVVFAKPDSLKIGKALSPEP